MFNKQNYWLIWSIILHFIIEHCWLLTDYPSEKKTANTLSDRLILPWFLNNTFSIIGLVFGFAQSMPFFAYAGCMYYGGYLVDQKELEYQNVFK